MVNTESDNFELLLKAIVEQTASFKANYLRMVEDAARHEYDDLPKKIASLNEKISKIHANIDALKATYLGDRGFCISDMRAFNESYSMRVALTKDLRKCNTLLKSCVKQLAIGKDSFVNQRLEESERLFNVRTSGLAGRLNKKGFSHTDLSFSSIENDPKLFDVLISSGNKSVHARSILAAEYSQCMVPHFRFIITEKVK